MVCEINILLFMRIKGSNASGQWRHCPQQAAVASIPTRHHAGPEPLIRIIYFFKILPMNE